MFVKKRDLKILSSAFNLMSKKVIKLAVVGLVDKPYLFFRQRHWYTGIRETLIRLFRGEY